MSAASTPSTRQAACTSLVDTESGSMRGMRMTTRVAGREGQALLGTDDAMRTLEMWVFPPT